jgi:hypothetical protein
VRSSDSSRDDSYYDVSNLFSDGIHVKKTIDESFMTTAAGPINSYATMVNPFQTFDKKQSSGSSAPAKWAVPAFYRLIRSRD